MRLRWAGAPAGRAPRRRLNLALTLSLLVHALLLSLTFGQGEGLPGLSLPWQARRADAADLRVVLQAEPGAAAPLPLPLSDVQPPRDSATPPPASADDTVPLKTLLPADAADEILPASPPPLTGPALLTAQRPDLATWAVAAASAVPTAVVATLPAASSPSVETLRQAGDALRARSDREPRDRAAELAQLEAERQQARATVVAAFASASSPAVEPLRRAADSLRTPVDREARERTAALSQMEGERQQAKATVVAAFASASSPAVEPLRRATDALRAPTDRERAVELAQLDGARAAAQQSAQRLEAARQEAARQEAARAEAGRQEAARQAAAQAAANAAAKAAAQLEAGRIEAAKLAAVQAEAEQREARLRAIGKQLDEEAAKRDLQRDAQRDLQRDAARQPPNWTPARRGRLFGRSDANEELVLYAEAWARKLQFNPTFEMVRDAARQPYTDPIVTVAVRSDGSVESVTFVRSSGVPALDDAVRRVVQSQERYPAFSPALLRDFDVVEIRRTWHFDTAIRLC